MLQVYVDRKKKPNTLYRELSTAPLGVRLQHDREQATPRLCSLLSVNTQAEGRATPANNIQVYMKTALQMVAAP